MIGSSDVLLERNIFRRNNVEQLTGYYPAAVKIFNQSRRVTCRDNLVIDNPNSNGIWYDVGNVDGVFVNNWVEGAHRRLLLRDLEGRDLRRQRVRRLRQGHPRAQQLERARLPQHLRRHRRLLRAQRAERGRRPLRLAPQHRPRRRRARGARVRRQPAGGERVVPQAAAALRAAEGAVRAAHPAAAEGARRQRLRPRRGRGRAAAPGLEPDARARAARSSSPRSRTCASCSRLSRCGAAPSATTWARCSGARELRRYELARLLPGLATADDLPADVRRLLGWREGDAPTPGAYPFHPEAPAARAARPR